MLLKLLKREKRKTNQKNSGGVVEMNYEKYYRDYLGIDKDKGVVFTSEQREKPMCFSFYHLIIGTEFQGREVVSASPKFAENFSSKREDENLKEYMIRSMDKQGEDLDFREMYRMGIAEEDIETDFYGIKVLQLKEDHRELFMESNKEASPERIKTVWNMRLPQIKDGRVFVVLEEEKIVCTARVSDIDCGGGNIAVWTDEQCRRKGYGRAVVSYAAKWCYENGILPIYLVHKENEPSVKLAERIGFKKFSSEYIFSERRK